MLKSKVKFDKELFKRSVLYNVKTLYRKTAASGSASSTRFKSSPSSVKASFTGLYACILIRLLPSALPMRNSMER